MMVCRFQACASSGSSGGSVGVVAASARAKLDQLLSTAILPLVAATSHRMVQDLCSRTRSLRQNQSAAECRQSRSSQGLLCKAFSEGPANVFLYQMSPHIDQPCKPHDGESEWRNAVEETIFNTGSQVEGPSVFYTKASPHQDDVLSIRYSSTPSSRPHPIMRWLRCSCSVECHT